MQKNFSGLSGLGEYMRDTVGTFTLEQVAAYAKTLIDEESFMELNKKLVLIKKK